MMVTDERTNMVSFTGSPPVGRQIASDAGMKMVTLELGNNSATIVDEDANLDLALQRVVAGGFANSGQICISVQRVIVHEAVYDEFLAALVPAVEALKVGDPLDETTDVATLIDQGEVDRVGSWILEAVAQGATLATGGVRDDGKLLPTVLTDVTRDMKVCANEVFGPVLSVIKARDLCEAIEISNDSEMGLQAGVFTNDLNKALYAAKHLEVGGVMINEVPTFRVDHMPYGGVKGSGMGREGVQYALAEMTELKMVTDPRDGLADRRTAYRRLPARAARAVRPAGLEAREREGSDGQAAGGAGAGRARSSAGSHEERRSATLSNLRGAAR